MWFSSLSGTAQRDEPEDLKIQPHQREDDPKRRLPLKYLGRSRCRVALNRIKVEYEVQRREHNDDQ